MNKSLQKTINSKINCSGVGLHSGNFASITLNPAPCNHGIVFRRTDKNNAIIKANYSNVVDTRLGTTIANADKIHISTIEHLMAAIWGCDIDNLLIDINGPEIPIMDGSSWPFVFLIECAGVIEQEEYCKILEIVENITVTDGDKYIKISPASQCLFIDLSIEFNHKLISHKTFSFNQGVDSFKNDICRARTFCFKSEIEQMYQMGLAKGGSLDNAIVIDSDTIVNPDGLRFENEFVRHKTLDFIGDIFLSGYDIIGKFEVFKSGHSLNNKMLKELFSQPEKWRLL
jgi:UDP-3-O-[3-hydroxymyristoyl] N-acetylglucosamine deacetylase